MVSSFGAVQPEEQAPAPASPMSLPVLGGVAPPAEPPASPMPPFSINPMPPTPQQPLDNQSPQGFDTAIQPTNLPTGVLSKPDAPVDGPQSVQSAPQDIASEPPTPVPPSVSQASQFLQGLQMIPNPSGGSPWGVNFDSVNNNPFEQTGGLYKG